MELLGTRDVRMVARVLEHPDFVMPEGFERVLPEAMAKIVTSKTDEGKYRYRPTARIRAAMALVKMLQVNEERAARRSGANETNIFISAASGDVNVAVQRLQEAGLSTDELRTLAASREIVQRIEHQAEATADAPDA